MRLADFDYDLPKELIAQYPAKERDMCRLMVLDRANMDISHRKFADITEYFKAGDCLILNDTKVISARLLGKRKTGGKVELFILEKKNPVCEALVKPSSRLREGEKITLESGDEADILDRGEIGRRVRFLRPLDDIIKSAGHIPLPPYIDRIDENSDRGD
jgi:S-adenosylmethionine:tRNA ribosyltransferase-isomerase